MPDLPSIFPEGSITWANALISVLILIAAFIVAHFAKKGVNALRTRLPGLHPELISLTARIVKYAIILLAVGIVLALLGANIQPVLAAVIIVAAVGFMAVRGIATNFGAAVIIQSRRSIHVGQWIEVLDFVGQVKELNSRAVVVTTRDGRTVHLPNVSVLENPMVNHSEGGATRSSLEVRVQGVDDLLSLRGTIARAAGQAPGVITGHGVDVLVRSVSPRAATLELRVWHAPLADVGVVSEVVTSVADALQGASVRATVAASVPPPPLTPPPAL
ncbi:mechanosensitive ion channel family protein [Plantibacter sp. YIM 135249]|uniref:mechanosensitive ion channel family protein n=1 Tax=Plantibacter sp. YIM 135249 TaxID=3423918 RepID=UPI003D325552